MMTKANDLPILVMLFLVFVPIHALGDARPIDGELVVGKPVASGTKSVLEAITREAGEVQIEVSSVNRSYAEQIAISLEAYGSAKDAFTQYGDPCRDAFLEDNRPAMIEKLKDILSQSPRPHCMRHVGTGGKVVDIKPSSVANHKAFYEAVMASDNVDTTRSYYPPIDGVPQSPVRDAAFHIEIK